MLPYRGNKPSGIVLKRQERGIHAMSVGRLAVIGAIMGA